MTKRKKYPHTGYRGEFLSRRELLKRMLALGGVGAAGARQRSGSLIDNQ